MHNLPQMTSHFDKGYLDIAILHSVLIVETLEL